MNDRRSYEMLLNAQYENHERMMYYLTQIRFYDDALLSEAKKKTPDSGAIEYVTIQKDRMVKKIDQLTAEITKTQRLIIEYATDYLDSFTNPVWQKLEKIHQLVIEQFREVLSLEDQNNPAIEKSLSMYRQRLELDEMIKKVPKEKRQVFFVRL